MLLHGVKGIGKSMICNYAIAWAHECNWITFAVHKAHEITHKKGLEVLRMENGLYHQKDEAVLLLKDFLHTNEVNLKKLTVDLSLYGTFDNTGVRDGDPEPCPREYDVRRKVWNDSWKVHLFETEI